MRIQHLDPGVRSRLASANGSRSASARSPEETLVGRGVSRARALRTGAGFVARLVIVSNRVAVPEEGSKAVAAGGLAVAVKEAFTGYEGLWFGWSGNVVEDPSDEPTLIDRDRVQYAVVDLSPQDHREDYAGFANRVLWPIMHYRLGLGAFALGLRGLLPGQPDLRAPARQARRARRHHLGPPLPPAAARL